MVITPSLDVGLYTQTKVSTSSGAITGTDSQIAGVQVTVTVDGGPAQPEVIDNSGDVTGAMYEQRFQQLSLNNIGCGAGSSSCDISFILSTLSAHSFNFVAPSVSGGNHTIKVYASLANPLTGETAACFGPSTLTAVQVKAFKQNN